LTQETRFNPEGPLDTSFGQGGGKILIAWDNGSGTPAMIARLLG
jgi:hypothetical protein